MLWQLYNIWQKLVLNQGLLKRNVFIFSLKPPLENHHTKIWKLHIAIRGKFANNKS